MMGRIGAVFSRIMKPAFIGFTVAGDPDKETCIRAAIALIDGGTDILELGVPFSDPVADGPTIQKADDISVVYNDSIPMCKICIRNITAYILITIIP